MGATLIIGALFTGLSTFIFTGSIIAGLVMTGLTLLMGLFAPKPKMPQMKPASLADFQVSQANEAQPIPIVYGTCKIAGNIIFYGNLRTEEVKQKSGRGGKGGGGSKEQVVGYKYYLDIWQAICHGKIEILDAFLDDDTSKKPSASYTIFNDGTMNTYPTTANAPQLEFASKLPSIAHIFYKQFYVGENRTFVPTVYFKVKRILQTGLNYENMTNGSNPAAVIFDLLVNFGGLTTANLNMQNFNQAATYFYQEGFGINYVISSTKKIREVCQDILNFVDAYLDYDENGKIVIKIFKKTDTPKGTIEDDFISFSFSKPSWNTVPNHFSGNYVEEGVVRTLIVENSAAKELAGRRIIENLDLTAFVDRAIALKRLVDAVKKDSFPRIALSIKVPLRYAIYSIGDVVTIKNSELEMNGDFRIVAISEPKIDSNEIDMQLLQHSDAFFDSYYQTTGGTQWQQPAIELVPFTKVKVLEIDYIQGLSDNVNLLILVSREKGYETGFAVYISQDGSSYDLYQVCSTFATAGTLVEQYPNTTFDIDDDVGLIFRPYKELEGTYLNIQRAELFSTPRCVVVNNEIMAFQNYTPYGQTDYKLTGIVRGVHWTTKATHNVNATVYVSEIKYNVVSVPYTSSFYIKVVPLFGASSGNIANATAIQVTPTMKAKNPLPPERLYAVRSGSTVNVDVFVISKESNLGIGKQSADVYTDSYPFVSEGRLHISTDGTNWEWKDTFNFTITNASSFTLRVKHYNNGRFSAEKTLSVGTADGEYIS